MTATVAALPLGPLGPERGELLCRVLEGLDAAQLQWLSGFAAGVAYARTPGAASVDSVVPSAVAVAPRAEATGRLAVVYGSQTGNGRRIAERLGQAAEAAGIAVRVYAARDYPLRDLRGVIIASGFMAGGALGQLIPPSLLFILDGFMANESVGRLFASGFVPGLILSGLFILYILIACHLKPSLGPATPPEDRGNWKEKFTSLGSVIMPILLVIAVLGSIFTGIATPKRRLRRLGGWAPLSLCS